MTQKKWRVIDPGDATPEKGAIRHVDFMCVDCMSSSLLPVVGLAIAQINRGLVFDGPYALPRVIQCRHCRTKMEMYDVR